MTVEIVSGTGFKSGPVISVSQKEFITEDHALKAVKFQASIRGGETTMYKEDYRKLEKKNIKYLTYFCEMHEMATP